MIESLTSFHFLRPIWLAMLPVVVSVWWLWLKQSDPLQGWRDQIDGQLLKALTVQFGSKRNRRAEWLLAGWILATVAVAGPTWRPEPNPFADDSTPLMVLLKADVSMDRPAPRPSRMERARLKVTELAEVRTGQPLGLIAYSGSAHLVLPPTRDTAAVSMMAGEISPAIMPRPGDRLDLAIRRAGELLSSSDSGGAMLVIADSVDMDLDELAAAQREFSRFPIHFLSLTDDGSSESESVRAAARKLNGAFHQLELDESDVQSVSRAVDRNTAAGIAGESTHWQEAGYWLVPLLAAFVAVSFRRDQAFEGKNSP